MGKKRRKPARVAAVLPALDTRLVQLSDADGGDGLTFRKKILPLGTIIYPKTRLHPGGPVTFDRAYHQTLIDAFNAGAYDHPPVQLADEANRHNMLPERTAGHIVALTTEQDGDTDGPGLYANVRALTKKHAKLLRRNPKIGVSPEIVHGLQTVHGRKFPAAVRHILATLDPRVRQLGEWRAVSLSDEDTDQVLDLTSANYEGITHMGKKAKKATAAAGDTLDLSDDDFEAALEEAARALEGDDRLDLADDLDGEAAEVAAGLLSLSAQNDALRDDVDEIRIAHAAANWRAERATLEGHVSKAVLDLAAPLLSGVGDTVVQLSDADGDDTIDARGVLRSILAEIAAGNAVIDLSAPGGYGDEPVIDPGQRDQVISAVDHLSNRFGD